MLRNVLTAKSPGLKNMNDEAIKRGAGVALWRQIQETIADEIASGIIAPGQRLPTEHDLAQRFHVNRHTVRRAMKALEAANLIKIEQGRGTYVLEHVIDYPVRRRTRFSENLSGQNLQIEGFCLLTETRPARSDVAEALDIAEGAPTIMIRTLRETDGRPVSMADHYFAAERFPDLGVAFEKTRSISKALAMFGVDDYFRKVTRVTARMPDKDETAALNQPPNRPLLVTESINVCTFDKPLEYGITRFSGDRVQLMFEP